MRTVHLLGCGAMRPKTVLSSEDIDCRLGWPLGRTRKRIGIASRPVCAAEDDQISMAVAACREALNEAAMSPDQIDVILFGASVGYQSIPATAPLIMKRLGITDGRTAAFDVNATCLSFLTAVDMVGSMVSVGRFNSALIVSSEIASRALPWKDDPLTAALFGDGAAAAVFGVAPVAGKSGRGLVAAHMETYPEGYEDCRLPSGGTRFDFHTDVDRFRANSLFRMNGKALYRHTLAYFDRFLDRLLSKAGWHRADVDVVVPHQASPLALDHLAAKCGFGQSKLINIIENTGNQVAASIPTALHAARRMGRLSPGTRVLMLGTSAGLSLGGLALEA